jgi:hypothetical protein
MLTQLMPFWHKSFIDNILMHCIALGKFHTPLPSAAPDSRDPMTPDKAYGREKTARTNVDKKVHIHRMQIGKEMQP